MRFRRLIILDYGPPDVLQMVEGELPNPGAGLVRIRVLAAGVSFSDLLMRRGLYPHQTQPPFTPGFDVVGEVEGIGFGVQGFRIGQTVCALTVYGGYSESLILPGRALFSVPAGLDRSETAAVVLNYVAAAQMLHRVAKVKRGGSILVHGAAGGVGSALVQLAKLAGIKVYGTASEKKLGLVEQLGAIPVERKRSFVEDLQSKLGSGHPGVDAVFDSIGPEFWKDDRHVLRSGGELVTFGSQMGYRPGSNAESKNWQQPFSRTRSLFGASRRPYSITEWRKQHPEWFHQDLTQMLHYLHEKRIKPIIGQTFPWQDAAQAHTLMENRELTGKAVLLF